jgi:hypothetical protein
LIAGFGKRDRLGVAHSREMDRCYPSARHAPCAFSSGWQRFGCLLM